MEELEETGIKRDALGRIVLGSASLNPDGRPELTEVEKEQQRVRKEALKEYVSTYRETLQELLALVPSALKDRVEKGDIAAIKELHERTLGKVEQKTDITSNGETLTPLLVKFLDDKSDNGNTQGV